MCLCVYVSVCGVCVYVCVRTDLPEPLGLNARLLVLDGLARRRLLLARHAAKALVGSR